MRIAVVGCAHGELDSIIQEVNDYEKKNQCTVDLIICCGDFQAVRNSNDLSCMSCPPKYLKMGEFYKYYSGEKKCDKLMLIIGGNHEASNHFLELHNGGWVAPNMYYIGMCGVVKFGGLRIAGVSGIFKAHDFDRPFYERCPFNMSMIKSIYHVRRFSIWRLCNMYHKDYNIDIMLSHDWPTLVCKYGAWKQLLAFKPHFKADMENDELGNPALNHLIAQLRPKRWFSGHLHCQFNAKVPHSNEKNQYTEFSAFDKMLYRRNGRCPVGFVYIEDTENTRRDPKTNKYLFEYEPTWLAILKNTHPLLKFGEENCIIPQKDNKSNEGKQERWDYRPTAQELQDIEERFHGNYLIPHNFTITVPPYRGENFRNGSPPVYKSNPQTVELLRILGIDDKMDKMHKENAQYHQRSRIPRPMSQYYSNTNNTVKYMHRVQYEYREVNDNRNTNTNNMNIEEYNMDISIDKNENKNINSNTNNINTNTNEHESKHDNDDNDDNHNNNYKIDNAPIDIDTWADDIFSPEDDTTTSTTTTTTS